jgi:hypothetical protein
MLSSELAAGNMIRAKQGKREIAPYIWVHPDDDRAVTVATDLSDAWRFKRCRRMSVIGGEPDSSGAARKRRE